MPNDGGRNDKKNGDVKVPARGWILLMAIIAFIPLLLIMRNQTEPKFKELSPFEFFQRLDNTNITISGTITYPPQTLLQEITGKYVERDDKGEPIVDRVTGKSEIPFRVKMQLTETDLKRLYSHPILGVTAIGGHPGPTTGLCIVARQWPASQGK